MIVFQSGGSSVIFSEWIGIFKEKEVPTSLSSSSGSGSLWKSTDSVSIIYQIVWYCGVAFLAFSLFSPR